MKRIINKELLATYRDMNCLACGYSNLVCAHHLKEKGAGGDDVESNLLAVCYSCHAKIHSQGLKRFASENNKVSWFLISNGWEFNEFLKRWVHCD